MVLYMYMTHTPGLMGQCFWVQGRSRSKRSPHWWYWSRLGQHSRPGCRPRCGGRIGTGGLHSWGGGYMYIIHVIQNTVVIHVQETIVVPSKIQPGLW